MAACREVDSALDLLIDGELSAAERAGIEQHLAECPACSARLSERRKVSGLIGEWAESAPAESPRVVRQDRSWMRAAAAAAAIVAVAGLAGELAPHPAATTVAPAQGDGHRLAMRSMNDGVTVVAGKNGEPDELVVDAFPVQLAWKPMSREAGVTVVHTAGSPEELVVDPFPITMRPMSSGVAVIPGKAGEPVELVVDPFPEEGK